MIAYVKTSYDPSMYLKYRIEIYPQLKTGSFPVSVYYKGSLLRTSFVTVKYTSENSIKWRKWVDNIEAAAWKDNNMTSKEKLSAIESYVRTHFTYDQARCTEGAAALLFAARDMNLQACYRFVGPEYDYAKGYGDEYYHLGMAYCGGHVCTMVTMNGEQQMFETNGYFE